MNGNVGEAMNATKSKSGHSVSSFVDDLLNKTSAGSSGSGGAEDRSALATERGFKVGEETDMYVLACSK